MLTSLTLAAGLLILPPDGIGAEPSEPELRVRLRSHSRHELIVIGLDGSDLRLRPIDTATGEIVVPLADARDLQFVVTDHYSRAQQLAFHGRSAEALAILEPLARALVPFLAAPGTNATPMVGLYLDLLLAQRRWDDALATANRLPLTLSTGAFLPKLMILARGLRAAARLRDATRLVARLPISAETPVLASQLDEFADELRRYGHYAEAEALYERLLAVDLEAARSRRGLLLAYTALHQAKTAEALRWLELTEEPAAGSLELPLYLLLRGRLSLDAQSPTDALDWLGRGLVVASGASEWASELLAITAMAYRAAGRTEVADTIEADRRRLPSASPAAARPPEPQPGGDPAPARGPVLPDG